MSLKHFLGKCIKKLAGTYKENINELRKRGVKIGENVDILNSTIDGRFGFLISIGNNVTITNATLLAHDASTKKFLGKSKIGKIEIGDNVFIGLGAIVLPNTKIGNNVIIGAGCVVSGVIEDNSVMIGNPAKKLCDFDKYIEKHKLNMEKVPVFNNNSGKISVEDKKQMIDKIKLGEISYDD